MTKTFSTTNFLQKRTFIIGMVSFLAALGYLLFSARVYSVGFPLDDAWIHQTYARNFAQTGEWAFIPGVRSAGSTSPLWTFILSIGYFLRIPPLVWSTGVGILCLTALATLGEMIVRREASYSFTFPFVGVFLALEWHLVWASVSGMETAIYAALIVLFFFLLGKTPFSSLLLGCIVGLIIWIRPDGITLLGPGLFVAVLCAGDWKEGFKRSAMIIVGAGLLIIPYLLFNYSIAGSWWPNTFYAKQAEYAVLTQTPFINRLFSLISLPLVGAGITVLPGFLKTLWEAGASRQWVKISAALWWLGYNVIYAARLPVTYQHGRYLIPSMAIFFILAAPGCLDLLNRLILDARAGRVIGKTWALVIIVTTICFFFMGANAFATDVAIIQTEMVETAQWIDTNLPQSALIAAHDIGAMGYYGNRKLVDLAGLISPEVILFIRNETALAEFMDQNSVDYLMTFPGWYPGLTANRRIVYQTNASFSVDAGGENMVVYTWK